jgi:hypothetical protein
MDATFNGTCQVIDFDNDIDDELKCDVRQRTIAVGAGLVINVSLRDLKNQTNRNGILCERRMQGAVIRNDLNITNGTSEWFNKPSWFNGNKTLCAFFAGGNGVADFAFPYINLWTR